MLPNSSHMVIATARQYFALKARRDFAARAVRKTVRLRHRFWSTVSGSEILLGASLGLRLSLPHPNGIVIHQDAVIGDDCMIMQQVTIGQVGTGGAPRIGSRVYVGAGAKILGEVVVGDDARIGANAVVMCDVPAGATAVGVPARVILQATPKL